MNQEDAIKATRQGAIAACISGVITFIAYIIGVASNAEGDNYLALVNDHTMIIDIILIFVLAWFIYKKSRVAAIAMFLYFIFAKFYIGIKTGEFSGIPVAVIFLFFYGKAILGAFTFHKNEKALNPNYKRASKWIIIPTSIIGVILLFLMAVGTMTETGFSPSTTVQTGDEVHQNHIDKLVENNIISTRDDIVYFFSPGLASVLEGGIILCEDSIVLYQPDEVGIMKRYPMSFKSIDTISLVQAGDFWNNAIYKVASKEVDDLWMTFELSVEADQHLDFIAALQKKTGAELISEISAD